MSTYCTSTWGTCTTASAINCGFSTKSALPRSVHVAEVVSEALVSELSAPASHRLDAVTEDHHSCVDVRNQSFPDLLTSESPLTHSNTSRSGITSANVKIIIADVDSTLSVGTLLVGGQYFTIYFSMFATASTFAILVSHSLWPCLGCAVSRCVLGALPDRLVLDRLVLLRFTRSLVLSVTSCNVTSFTARACEDLPSVTWFEPKDAALRSMSRRPWPA